MSRAHAGERLSAYQRWELASFDERPAAAEPQQPGPGELDTRREQAQREGYAAGYAEGRERSRLEAERLAHLVAGVEQALREQDQRVAEALVTLAVSLARQIVRQTIELRRELILPVVTEAMRALPAFSASGELVVHPEDATLVREHLGEQLGQSAWKVVEDAHLERGGCRIATSASEVDATLETRWQRVVATLGREEGWRE